MSGVHSIFDRLQPLVPINVDIFVAAVGKTKMENGQWKKIDIVFNRFENDEGSNDNPFDAVPTDELPYVLDLQDGVADFPEESGYLCSPTAFVTCARSARVILKAITFVDITDTDRPRKKLTGVRIMRTVKDDGIVRCDYCITSDDDPKEEFECSDEEFQSYTMRGLKFYSELHALRRAESILRKAQIGLRIAQSKFDKAESDLQNDRPIGFKTTDENKTTDESDEGKPFKGLPVFYKGSPTEREWCPYMDHED